MRSGPFRHHNCLFTSHSDRRLVEMEGWTNNLDNSMLRRLSSATLFWNGSWRQNIFLRMFTTSTALILRLLPYQPLTNSRTPSCPGWNPSEPPKHEKIISLYFVMHELTPRDNHNAQSRHGTFTSLYVRNRRLSISAGVGGFSLSFLVLYPSLRAYLPPSLGGSRRCGKWYHSRRSGRVGYHSSGFPKPLTFYEVTLCGRGTARMGPGIEIAEFWKGY